jgi:hypothetical protein
MFLHFGTIDDAPTGLHILEGQERPRGASASAVAVGICAQEIEKGDCGEGVGYLEKPNHAFNLRQRSAEGGLWTRMCRLEVAR